MSKFSSSDRPAKALSVRVLVAGDLLAFLIFVIVGRMVHTEFGPADWLLNAPRIAAPFLVGWVIAARLFDAYPRSVQYAPSRFLLNSLLALWVGDLIALGIRNFALDRPVSLIFALTALAFTTLLVVGWRMIYLMASAVRTAPTGES